MSVYMTEAEQLEEIKKWWVRHQNWITLCLSVIVLIVAGYRYWNWHLEKTNYQTSTSYENMMMAVEKKDDKSIQSYANQLIKDNEKSIYASVAHLTLAKVFVNQKNIKKAEFELNQVANHSKIDVFQQIATLRLVRLWMSQKLYDKALTKLSSLDQSSYYLLLVNELKGDIFTAQGEYSKAYTSYQAAINESHSKGHVNHFLEMKSDTAKTMIS